MTQKNRRYSRSRGNKTTKKIKPVTLDLIIQDIGANGDGVAHYHDMRIFVPKTMTGEHVQVRIKGGVKDGCHAHLLSITNPSSERKTPDCPHFDHCGGCDLQHLGQEAYRAWKTDKVRKTIERAEVHVKEWEPPIFLPANNRRRTTLAVRKTSDTKVEIGYHPPRSHAITSIAQCPILEPELEAMVSRLKPYLLILAPLNKNLNITIQKAGGIDMVLTGEWRETGDFSLAQNEVIADMMAALKISRLSIRPHEHAACEVLLTRQNIMKSFGAISVPIAPGNFLQASDHSEKILCELAMDHIGETQHIADLFCGSGTFTGHLLSRKKTVTAIDGDEYAIRALSKIVNPNLKTLKRNLFKDPLRPKELDFFDAVILDPPRSGAKAQCEHLAYSNTPMVVYISCNPATFYRDASILIGEGDYELQSIRLIDQFVWSSHCEIIALFMQ